eukprot:6177894-Pleurochrysis_carterae.AAC.2
MASMAARSPLKIKIQATNRKDTRKQPVQAGAILRCDADPTQEVCLRSWRNPSEYPSPDRGASPSPVCRLRRCASHAPGRGRRAWKAARESAKIEKASRASQPRGDDETPPPKRKPCVLTTQRRRSRALISPIHSAY